VQPPASAHTKHVKANSHRGAEFQKWAFGARIDAQSVDLVNLRQEQIAAARQMSGKSGAVQSKQAR
jgi:hypothetical protein